MSPAERGERCGRHGDSICRMLSVLVLVAVAAFAEPQEPVPVPSPAGTWSELILTGGAIWTGTGEPWAAQSKLSARYHLIESSGTKHRGAVEVALPDEAFVMPGLQDAHGHLLGLGSSLAELDLVGTKSFQQIIEMVVQQARQQPEGTWIVGRGWDQNDWSNRDLPNHRALSLAVPNHLVWLTRIDGHAGLANEQALRAAKIAANSVAPSGGEILLDDAGEPTGVLVDAAMAAVPNPGLSDEQIQHRLLAAQQACLEHGLTSVHDMGVSQRVLDAMLVLHAEQKWFLRTYVLLTPDERELIRRGPWQSSDGLIVVRGVKAYADGALGSRGAALLAPYSDRPSTRGLVSMPKGAILALAQLCAEHQMQLCTHAIGDAANRTVLDAYEAVKVNDGIKPLRFRVEHAQVIAKDDFMRFAKLGVLPSMQPTHLTSDMPWAPERLGAERVLRAYAWRSFHALDVVVPFGSDFPVESVDPRRGIYAAVTTKSLAGGVALRPDQQLSREQALRGFTQAAAYAAFAEDRLGTIAPGKLADFTVFDRNLLTCADAELLQAKVLLTVIGGQIVYDGRDK